MSPIDDELHTTLRRRADLLTPPADPLGGIERRAGQIRRRRAAGAMVGAVLAVTAVAVAVPLAFGTPIAKSNPESSVRSSSPTPTHDRSRPSKASVILTTDRSGLTNFINWPFRGCEKENALFTEEVASGWFATFKIVAHEPVTVGHHQLWQCTFSGVTSGIWQMWFGGGSVAYTVVAQQWPSGKTLIRVNGIAPNGVREISSKLQVGRYGSFIVLGPPQTNEIHYVLPKFYGPLPPMPASVNGKGWALFYWTGPILSGSDRVEILDENGQQIYLGPID